MTDGVDTDGDGIPDNDIVYNRVGAGDGFATMADGNELYSFGFSDLTEVDPGRIMTAGMLRAEIPAPTLVFKEGQQVLPRPLERRHADAARTCSTRTRSTSTASRRRPRSSTASRWPRSRSTWARTLRYYYNIVGAGHLPLPLPRGSHRAHGDGHDRQPLRAPKQNNLAERHPAGHPEGSSHRDRRQVRLQRRRRLDLLRRRVPLQLPRFDRNFHEQHIAVQPLPFCRPSTRATR